MRGSIKVGYWIAYSLPVPVQVGVSEHCAAMAAGPTGPELVVTGGRNRDREVLKLSLKYKK